MSILVGLIIVILLVLASGLFVAVEFSLIAADRSKLEALATEGRWPARSAVRALKRLSFHLSGAQLGITITSLVLGFLAEPIIGRLIDPTVERVTGSPGSTISIVIALLAATVFQMVVGELVPKNIAISHPEGVAQALSPVATVVHGALAPVIYLFNGSANWMIGLVGIEPREEMETHRSIEELAHLIRTSGDSGALDPESHNLLTRTLRFGTKTAADALTPRVHVAAVEVRSTVSNLAALVAESQHSFYPVYEGDLDHIRGIATITGIFETPVNQRSQVEVGHIMRQPLFVPETRDLVDILDDLRAADLPIAVVIDEHGGTAGILTLEDVLEELVGEIDDEHDDAQPLTQGVADGVHLLAGTLHLDEVADLSGLQLPSGDYETIAGFVLEQLGRIPSAGDLLSHDGWWIEVAEMDGLRVASLQVQAPAPTGPDQN